MTFSKFHRGEVSGRGSISKTSRPAPAIVPDSKDLIKSFSTTEVPLPILIKNAEGLKCLKSFELKISLVWSVPGRQLTTKSPSFKSDGRSDISKSLAWPFLLLLGFLTTPYIFMPKQSAILAIRSPIRPIPTMIMVLPKSSRGWYSS